MNISAVLLAGGESRRMRKDKATLLFRGRPLWQIQLELLRQLGPAEIFISARTDPTWRPADVEFVADDLPSRGPLSGLAGSLERDVAMCTVRYSKHETQLGAPRHTAARRRRDGPRARNRAHGCR